MGLRRSAFASYIPLGFASNKQPRCFVLDGVVLCRWQANHRCSRLALVSNPAGGGLAIVSLTRLIGCRDSSLDPSDRRSRRHWPGGGPTGRKRAGSTSITSVRQFRKAGRLHGLIGMSFGMGIPAYCYRLQPIQVGVGDEQREVLKPICQVPCASELCFLNRAVRKLLVFS